MDFSFQKNGFLKPQDTKLVTQPWAQPTTPKERMDRMKFDRPMEKKIEELPKKPLDERLIQQHKMDVLKELGRNG